MRDAEVGMESYGGPTVKKSTILRALALNDKMQFYGRVPRERDVKKALAATSSLHRLLSTITPLRVVPREPKEPREHSHARNAPPAGIALFAPQLHFSSTVIYRNELRDARAAPLSPERCIRRMQAKEMLGNNHGDWI